ncbi:hypothetical protein ACQ9EW_04810 [Klebsiella pneumoniae]|uniref:hypothetical protein n=1 Tax=Klebsiella pneumoniae TaxID=573 RepID=UPI001E630AA9|nr:hypothetical protein [Klebsiella pneumoniae]MCE7430382.1 hypothetical protein [Klebsiella pneumoniae]MCP0985809.1 hypothetical protein [Klebsiella pneumoniae]MCP6537180.1 hypothetical protein [Klebsiella pneumoniae]MDV1645077.1 hypothetical protein [Klebsiella pneumoniae]MDW2415974.1 hypothetical protein [Klebsiella pneumoniae]
MSNSAYLRRVQPVANEEFNVHTLKHSDGNGGGGDMEQRLAVLEAKASHIESDVTELKNTVAVVDKNTAVILERLDGIKESLAKKPSSDAVDKKIAEAKVSQIIWTIGSVLAIVSIASGIVIKVLHS